ncbi:adenosylhomocysteinase [Streptomyces sp. NPDC016566]|uniref:adenosylhomocysteinase n=1 Tax=Streptomyces sp. NPDC016566 TaxID=3364967 RepID=UPI0036FD48C4
MAHATARWFVHDRRVCFPFDQETIEPLISQSHENDAPRKTADQGRLGMTSLTTPSAGPDASARNPHTLHNDHRTDPDFRVRDFSLAAQGRNTIRLAEHEMPVLMALGACYAGSAPLADAKTIGDGYFWMRRFATNLVAGAGRAMIRTQEELVGP